jgi:protein-L-isoaspartate(D-aspartate) O-methyltransferase
MGVDFQAQRIKMVDGQLRTTDVTGHALLDAFLEIPRENFVPEAKRALAYLDADIEVSPGRFLAEASPFAKLLTLADIKPGDNVLNIGATTGYTAAIIARLAAKVVALESDAGLSAASKANLEALGITNVEFVAGGLEDGHAKSGPYDVIALSGSVPQVPDALLQQLKGGGRLVAVEGTGHLGKAKLFVRNGKDISSRFGFNASIKPLPGFTKTAEFAL